MLNRQYLIEIDMCRRFEYFNSDNPVTISDVKNNIISDVTIQLRVKICRIYLQ